MNTKTITVIAVMAIVMSMGFASAEVTDMTKMDYTVNFDGFGTGAISIFTLTDIGTDLQNVNWENCAAMGSQDGHYKDNGWMRINRDTRIDTASNVNNDPVYGSIVTQSQLSTNGGSWTPGTVLTYAELDDSYIGNSPEDYIDLNQRTSLRDNGNGNERIKTDTEIAARLFDNAGDGTDAFKTGVVTTSDATGNVSTSVVAGLTEGEISMNVRSKLVDGVTNVERSGTIYKISVPNMPGYKEQNTGYFGGQSSIDGIVIDSMMTIFENVDNIDTTGYFYAVK